MENDCIVTLTDEQGCPVRFEFLDVVPYEGCDYFILLPQGSTDNEVVILREKEVGEETVSYATVEDEETLEAVFQLFVERSK